MNWSVQAVLSWRGSLAQRAAAWWEELRLRSVLLVTAQLGLVLLVLHTYQIEQTFGLLELTPLLFGGFIAHALLPLRYRLPFFLALSMGAIALVLGALQGAGLIALGLGLIGLCHLPVAFRLRVALVVVAGAILVAVRAGWVEMAHWSGLRSLVLPVLAAMFMFRLIIYLYDLRHEKEPASLWERLAYFFMLPNVCFLLFPVVDYQTFRRTYFDADAAAIYQKGVLWMYRGVVHLLLYRLVYHHFIPDPAEVVSLGGVVQSILTTYLLYLRISGQFHLIIGIMCLFGFNLPETHHLYFLASSFTDFWRRINIYWKDFMMKIFYYPVLMRLRRWGMTTALVGATLVVFAGTWLLHSYQWFWLRGAFPIAAPDALFWGILGGLVVVNALREAKRSRKRLVRTKGWDAREALVLSLRTVGMFVFISVLWSLWSSPTVGAWVALVAKAGNSGVAAWGLLLLGLGALVGVGVALQYAASRGWGLSLTGSHPSPARSAAVTSLGALALLAVGQPGVQARLGARPAALVASVQTDRLNWQDQETVERGYYEGLLNAETYTSALLNARAEKPADWLDLHDSHASVRTSDLRGYELAPLNSITFKRAVFSTNRWGMRDKDYPEQKPPGTYRIALLGSSHVMGAGVGDGETFESVLEDMLNGASQGAGAYEIMNFAVGGHGLLQQVALAEVRTFRFQPDAVFYVVHPGEMRRTASRFARVAGRALDHEDEALRRLVQQAGVVKGMSSSEIEERLQPINDRLVEWGFEKLAALSVQHEARPVLVFMPFVATEFGEEEFSALTDVARRAGFSTLNLSGAYGGYGLDVLKVAPWDDHPSVLGHRLIAERLYHVLLQNEGPLGLPPAAPQQAELTSTH